MTTRLQSGIHHNNSISDSYRNGIGSTTRKNKTFALIFLRAKRRRTAQQVAESLLLLWDMYTSLRKGVVIDLPGCYAPPGGLELAIGYGPLAFKLEGAKKSIPRDLFTKQFATAKGGRAIIRGSGIKFASNVHENVGLREHIAIQFTSDIQVATHRAIVETWKLLSNNSHKTSLILSKYYSGFQRNDGRSWIGFHDEVSNLKPSERRGIISISKKWNRLIPSDFWTEGGTYLAFLKIAIDLTIWQRFGRKQQELFVGREKTTGKPIVAVDKLGNPIIRKKCPNFEAIKEYSMDFHEHPDYFLIPSLGAKKMRMVDVDATMKTLNQCHIGRTRHIEGVNGKDPSSNRIFRQGFEFIESSQDPRNPIKIGLNFVSFQNDPQRLFSLLASPHWLGSSNFGGDPRNSKLEGFLTVNAAGIFFLPATEKPFPGSSILQ
jgi:deferrochelatase/peroxidase EfeB